MKELRKEAKEKEEEWEKKKAIVAMEGLIDTLKNNTVFTKHHPSPIMGYKTQIRHNQLSEE